MGVDYEGVGGVGIELTDEMIEQLKNYSSFTEEEWEDGPIYYMEKCGFLCFEGGSYHYTGEKRRFYFLVPGDTLKEVTNNAPTFIKNLAAFGIQTTVDDLKIISDLLIW